MSFVFFFFFKVPTLKQVNWGTTWTKYLTIQQLQLLRVAEANCTNDQSLSVANMKSSLIWLSSVEQQLPRKSANVTTVEFLFSNSNALHMTLDKVTIIVHFLQLKKSISWKNEIKKQVKILIPSSRKCLRFYAFILKIRHFCPWQCALGWWLAGLSRRPAFSASTLSLSVHFDPERGSTGITIMIGTNVNLVFLVSLAIFSRGGESNHTASAF